MHTALLVLCCIGVVAAGSLISGCKSSEPKQTVFEKSELELPDGWGASSTRMWKEGVDTSEVFRDLSDLAAMGVIEEDFTLGSGSISQEQFKKAIKKSLTQLLYRSNPALVDSLFEEYAVPTLKDADLSGTVVEDGQITPELLKEYQRKTFEAIRKHYRQPSVEEGVSGLSYPDSLRQANVSGTVQLQIHVNKDGAVDAIEVVESVHPTLDAIAMKAATKVKWKPVAIKHDDDWMARAGWARQSVPFRLR